MTKDLLIRLILTGLPLLLTGIAWMIRRPSRRQQAGILLSLIWSAWTLFALNMLASRMGWWRFDPGLPSFMGVALEPWLGWTLLWGAVLPLVAFDRAVAAVLVGAFWLDLIVMPFLGPVVTLQPGWLLAEAAGVILVLLPGLLLVRWTTEDTHLNARVTMQVTSAGALFGWLVPSVALSRSGGWSDVMDAPLWLLVVAAQVLLVPCCLGLRAVIELAQRGRGTPMPFDASKHFVGSGPYSYVRNPMQISIVALFLLESVFLSSAWLLAAAVVAWAYGAGLASWHENEDLTRRFGERWAQYRKNVPAWIPRWRPHVSDEASLLVAYSCGICSSIGRWFLKREPIGLKILPAENFSDAGLRRLTYVPRTGVPSTGAGAAARALEHLNLGWAMVAWFLLLPIVDQFAQVIADAVGPGPQRVAGLPYDETACRVERV